MQAQYTLTLFGCSLLPAPQQLPVERMQAQALSREITPHFHSPVSLFTPLSLLTSRHSSLINYQFSYDSLIEQLQTCISDHLNLRYVLILYTEDQAVQNDGTLSDPIYFEATIARAMRSLGLFADVCSLPMVWPGGAGVERLRDSAGPGHSIRYMRRLGKAILDALPKHRRLGKRGWTPA